MSTYNPGDFVEIKLEHAPKRDVGLPWYRVALVLKRFPSPACNYRNGERFETWYHVIRRTKSGKYIQHHVFQSDIVGAAPADHEALRTLKVWELAHRLDGKE